MEVKAIIERGNDGLYSVYMNDNSLDFGLNGQGQTVNEAKEDFLASYEEIKDLYKEENKTIHDLKFIYEYDVDSFLNYFSGILSKSGLEKITGINQKQLWHYSSGKRKPSKLTIEKIQTRIHKFAEDLYQIKFIEK